MLRVLKGFIFKRFVIPILGMFISFSLITNYYICIDDVLKKINSGKIIEIQSKIKIMLPLKAQITILFLTVKILLIMIAILIL